MKIGVIDVGGGLRGVYPAGIFDVCMEKGIHFDCCIGVSAGSANLASYLAGQKGRILRFYYEYSKRKEYMSMRNLLHSGSFINLDYVYGTLCKEDGESPLDYDAIMKNEAEFLVVATNAFTGKPAYFTKNDLKRDDYRILMASSCIPVVNRPYLIDYTPYYDGAISDPVPVKKAFEEGCDKVVLILTKPRDTVRTPEKDIRLAAKIKKQYPHAAENLAARADIYNTSVQLAKEYEALGKVLILAPDSTEGVSTLSRTDEAILSLYRKGRRDAEKITAWLEGSLS